MKITDIEIGKMYCHTEDKDIVLTSSTELFNFDLVGKISPNDPFVVVAICEYSFMHCWVKVITKHGDVGWLAWGMVGHHCLYKPFKKLSS